MQEQRLDTCLPPIVCCIDDRYVLPFCVLLESLARSSAHFRGDLQILVVHEVLSVDSKKRIDRHAKRLGLRVEYFAADPVDNRFPTDGPHPGQFTHSVYLRLLIGDMLPAVPRALYLDADLVVLGDIRPLLLNPMKDQAIGAVQDPIQLTLDQGYALPGWQEEGVPGDREYFNSGVLLLNLEECRSRGLFERALNFLVDFPERAACLDQDALNWASNDEWLRLDRCWNTLNSQTFISYFGSDHFENSGAGNAIELLLEDERKASILHFAGPRKPWSAECPESEAVSVYRRLLRVVMENDQ
ncbi:glycosyltransferase family 8 protein [Nocardia vinacea]|uniref:glycosyltransferase family 8 protein n=1 Tax=Nocardia vinacea TaxID=96468 RepID=UPI0033F54344